MRVTNLWEPGLSPVQTANQDSKPGVAQLVGKFSLSKEETTF